METRRATFIKDDIKADIIEPSESTVVENESKWSLPSFKAAIVFGCFFVSIGFSLRDAYLQGSKTSG